jgi:hypothetical protein
MQLLQPMQAFGFTSTMPSARFSSAEVGQIVTQGAAVHWLQRRTANERFTAGNSPASVYFTHVRKLPTGTSFSLLHATVQAWHPMHFEWSMTKLVSVISFIILLILESVVHFMIRKWANLDLDTGIQQGKTGYGLFSGALHIVGALIIAACL